jgi:restriction endonuclease Mrr
MLIREPLSTTLFFITGFVLATLNILKGVVKSGSLRRKANSFSVKDLDDLPPGEFEEMTAELFRALGYEAHRTKMIGDHGVDVVVKAKDGRKMIVQCKRWRGPVGEPMVRDFYGAMQHEKASKGTIFATNGFTNKAIEWAKGKPLLLYDGKKFLELWKKVEGKRLTG